MASALTATGGYRFSVGEWLTGAGAGAVGAVAASIILFATGAFELSSLSVEALGVLVMPGAIFGLLYAGIVSLGSLGGLAAEDRTGTLLGLAYGFLFWLTTLVGGSVTIGGLLASLAFGLVIALLYAHSPYVPA